MNHSIRRLLQNPAKGLNIDPDEMKQLQGEADHIFNTVSSGLMAIGGMMTTLGIYANNDTVRVTDTPIDHHNLIKLGEFIQTQGYILKLCEAVNDGAYNYELKNQSSTQQDMRGEHGNEQ